MRLWICDTCGASERLSIYPDCCSFCGGMMTTQDGRSTAETGGDAPYSRDELEFQWACEHETDDPAMLIRKWHKGINLTRQEQDHLDNVLLQGRVALLSAIFPMQEAA